MSQNPPPSVIYFPFSPGPSSPPPVMKDLVPSMGSKTHTSGPVVAVHGILGPGHLGIEMEPPSHVMPEPVLSLPVRPYCKFLGPFNVPRSQDPKQCNAGHIRCFGVCMVPMVDDRLGATARVIRPLWNLLDLWHPAFGCSLQKA